MISSSHLHITGVSKRVEKLARKKSCVAARAWSRSVSNHMNWVAASTPDGNGEMMLAKWLSVANHIQNVHDHDSQLFPNCLHGPLDESERKKKWLKPSKFVCYWADKGERNLWQCEASHCSI